MARSLRLRVREPARRATKFIVEGKKQIEYQGGEEADVPLLEALQKLATSNFDLCDGSQLSHNEMAYVGALMDSTWAPRHGRYPTPAEFDVVDTEE